MKTNIPNTVLITGGAGFIGSHLTERLLAKGREVIILDDLTTGGLENLSEVIDHSALRFEQGSVMDDELVQRLADGADTIVHLAAAVGVQLILDQPVHTIETNVRGTENVLHAAKASGSRVFVASTSEVYGKGIRYPFSEDDDIVLGPTSRSRWAYAASKMLDEFACFAHHAESGLRATPFRLFNTVGARQTGRYGMVVPRLVNQALHDESLTVYGDGSQRRCFGDVRDVVAAIDALLDHPDLPVQTYNIGTTEEVTIEDLALRIIAATGSNSEIVHIPFSEAFAPGFEDMERRIPDTTRIRELTGWQPTRSLDEIISSVVEHERLRSARTDGPTT